MRHFLAYHNAVKMGYSSTTLARPQVWTRNPVTGLEGVTVWLIAGEGMSPKQYFLAARFIAEECCTNAYPGTKLPNLISGAGNLYKLAKPISGTSLIQRIIEKSRNFRNGFHEIHDSIIIHSLASLA